MARLAFPPTLTRIAACASTTIANPAARISIQQRAPIQSAASRTIKASVARPSLILSGAPRTTLRAAATALQRAQSTRDELAAASKTISAGACIRALHGKKIVYKTPANHDQNENEQTYSRIPKPKCVNNMQMKARQRVTLVYKKIDKNKEKEKEIVKNISHENAVTCVDNNSDLLEDVSFDENIPGGVQSHYTHYFSRMDLRIQTGKQGGRIARVPRYGGDFFILPCQRRSVRKAIAIKPGSTLKCLGLHYPPSPSTAILQQIKAERRFGFGFKKTVPTANAKADENRPDSAVAIASVINNPAPTRKTVHFPEDADFMLFNPEAPAKLFMHPPTVEDGWTPIKLATPYPRKCQAVGFDTIFTQSGPQTIGIKRRVLNRFKSVQECEKRRKQESIAAGEHPGLGQLEYGNADYKFALQSTKLITANDIGIYVDPSDLGIPATACNHLNGQLLHFGGFQDELGRDFEDAHIPSAVAAAHKKPIDWKHAPDEKTALEKWIRTTHATVQTADNVE